MIYHSAEFIFFVAFTLYFFHITPARFRVLVLLIASLFWYSSWSPLWLLVFSGLFILNHFTMKLFGRPEKKHPWFFPTLIALDVLIFVALKTLPLWQNHLEAPYGVSFFMMMLLALVFDRWRQPSASGDFLPSWLMLMFFPLLVSGPIERGKNIFPQLGDSLALRWRSLADGILVFAYGFAKHFFLAAPLAVPMRDLFEHGHLGPAELALAALLSTLQAYLDFSSYCDMGRGAALCFGVRVSFNFRPFYYARSPHDFWQRWNISIGTWMRDYFTMPLLLRFGRRVRPAWLVFFSFVLIGLWHGLQWNWLCFGVFNGLLVALYLGLQSWLRTSRRAVFAGGLLLALVLFVGNGLWQHPEALALLRASVHESQPGMAAFFLPEWQSAMKALLPAFILLFIFEFWQERRGNLDFYLELPAPFKALLATSCVLAFLAMLHFNVLPDYKIDLPLYFRF